MSTDFLGVMALLHPTTLSDIEKNETIHHHLQLDAIYQVQPKFSWPTAQKLHLSSVSKHLFFVYQYLQSS